MLIKFIKTKKKGNLFLKKLPDIDQHSVFLQPSDFWFLNGNISILPAE